MPGDRGRMSDWRLDRIGSAARGENPTVLARLPAGFAVIGDVQWLPGYCLLLSEQIGVTRLSDLPLAKRVDYLTSMERLGSAVERACADMDPEFRRINLEILGNTGEDYLHAHIWPRYGWEPIERMRNPVWLYPEENWRNPDYALSSAHDDLRAAITRYLDVS